MNGKICLSGFVIAVLAGCASHPIRRGQVVMKISATTAHVAMGKNEVQVGDHVELYHNDCTVVGERSSKRQCKKVATGHGEVTSTFDGDYSEVTFPEGTKFVEGDTVEKHQH
jgi:hypothetical protein